MKKILSGIILTMVLSVPSYGAVSPDMAVYVRQDVFDAKMEALRTEIQSGNEKILSEIRLINTKMEEMDKRLNSRIDEMDKRLTGQIAAVETHSYNRHEDLKTMIYWGFSILGLLIAFAIFAPSFAEFLRNLRKPSISLEEVQALIEKTLDARLAGIPRA